MTARTGKGHSVAAERERDIAHEDEKLLQRASYRQELARRMSGFSNFAISMSTICILAGGLTSFHVGLCSVGGAAIGIGWPAACLFSLIVAATMAQVASAFPTAGGPYHWSSILGGRAWGWATACFNLAGLVTVLAAINVGACRFALAALDPAASSPGVQKLTVVLITASQALINQRGIRLTSRLIDVSGYLIVVVAAALTAALLVFGIAAIGFHPDRLVTFANYSGLPAGDSPVWPRSDNLLWLFALGLLLPAYTITGFDASAHTAEETLGAAHSVPRGIVRAVWVSGLAGWILLAAIVLAIPNMAEAAAAGEQSFFFVLGRTLPPWLHALLYSGILAAQYLCGLATLTSASRMTYAFARDGGLPFSALLRRVNPTNRCPSAAIWAAAVVSASFAVAIPYETVAAICAVFLYISYVLPAALSLRAYGRTWTRMGPWHIGRWYRPLALLSVLGCGLLIVIGVQPPNDIAVWIVGGCVAVLVVAWWGGMGRRFPGPPHAILHMLHREDGTDERAELLQRR
ncbi:MAG TPA: amino acid permease [Gemmataceae bacterium]